jgi:hypothetical protein
MVKDDVSLSGMELQTFIRETLTSIIKVVADAQRGLEGVNNAVINPLTNELMGHAAPAPIEFDIAVTVSADTTNKGQLNTGFKLRVPLMEVGLGGGLRRLRRIDRAIQAASDSRYRSRSPACSAPKASPSR